MERDSSTESEHAVVQVEQELPQRASYGESEVSSAKSEREKVEEFALQRNIEQFRVFYSVLLLSMWFLLSGVILFTATEILWRVLPAGRLVEWAISAFSAFAWFLTALTVAVVSTCPIDELSFDSFVAARPTLSMSLGVLPLLTGGLRALEMPVPRLISILVGFLFILQGCLIRCRRRHFQLLGPLGPIEALQVHFRSTSLMELWYLDVVLASTINEIALDEPSVATSAWLGVHACACLLVSVYLRWKGWQETLRFYLAPRPLRALGCLVR